MSAAPPPRRARGTSAPPGYESRGRAELRLRRRDARRRRGLFRQDVAFGVLAAIVLLLATPGIAIAAIVALLVLVAIAASVVIERRRSMFGERLKGGQ
jgi:hypothetical protein